MPFSEFMVIDPPTSEELRKRVANLIEERRVSMPITAIASQEVPKPEVLTFAMRVISTMGHLEDHGMTILGDSDDYPSIRIDLNPEPEQPAKASIVTL